MIKFNFFDINSETDKSIDVKDITTIVFYDDNVDIHGEEEFVPIIELILNNKKFKIEDTNGEKTIELKQKLKEAGVVFIKVNTSSKYSTEDIVYVNADDITQFEEMRNLQTGESYCEIFVNRKKYIVNKSKKEIDANIEQAKNNKPNNILKVLQCGNPYYIYLEVDKIERLEARVAANNKQYTIIHLTDGKSYKIAHSLKSIENMITNLQTKDDFGISFN